MDNRDPGESYCENTGSLPHGMLGFRTCSLKIVFGEQRFLSMETRGAGKLREM
jgi:hypothetical protein